MSLARLCDMGNCSRSHYAKGLCNAHYAYNRYWARKKIPRSYKTIHDRRPATIHGNTASIPIGMDAKGGYAMVDKEYAWLDRYNWCNDKDGYVVSRINNRLTRMHHMITGIPKKGLEVDHINRLRNDNRASNLRIVTHAQNMKNLPWKGKLHAKKAILEIR